MSVPTIGDEIALWSEYHGVKFDAEAYEARKAIAEVLAEAQPAEVTDV